MKVKRLKAARPFGQTFHRPVAKKYPCLTGLYSRWPSAPSTVLNFTSPPRRRIAGLLGVQSNTVSVRPPKLTERAWLRRSTHEAKTAVESG